MTKQTMIDLYGEPDLHKRAGLVLATLGQYLNSPLPETATQLSKALRDYQASWIETNAPDWEGEVHPQYAQPGLLRQIHALAGECLEGNAVEAPAALPKSAELRRIDRT